MRKQQKKKSRRWHGARDAHSEKNAERQTSFMDVVYGKNTWEKTFRNKGLFIYFFIEHMFVYSRPVIGEFKRTYVQKIGRKCTDRKTKKNIKRYCIFILY